MQTADQPTETTIPPPSRQPLRPAHPQSPSQPVLVADELTGTPVWIYPPEPPAPAPPRIDPMAQRIMAFGLASPLIGYGATLVFGAMAGATTAIGYLAICLACAAFLRMNSSKAGGSIRNDITITVDNGGR